MKFGKQLGSLALVAMSALGFASAAQAVNTWTVYNNPSDVKLCSGGGINCVDRYGWTYDINDNYGSPDAVFFDPTLWMVTDADIYLYLYDDSSLDSYEYVRFRFDGNWTGSYEVDGSSWNPDRFRFDLDSLLSDGILRVLLDATSGDFYFAYSRLVVTTVRRVSEPGTLALLGLGLMGIGFAARRRAK